MQAEVRTGKRCHPKLAAALSFASRLRLGEQWGRALTSADRPFCGFGSRHRQAAGKPKRSPPIARQSPPRSGSGRRRRKRRPSQRSAKHCGPPLKRGLPNALSRRTPPTTSRASRSGNVSPNREWQRSSSRSESFRRVERHSSSDRRRPDEQAWTWVVPYPPDATLTREPRLDSTGEGHAPWVGAKGRIGG